MSQPQGAFSFKDFDAEVYLTRRLGEHGAKIFEGDTTPQARRERFRSAIVTHGLDYVIVGRNAQGKPETYAALFERLFNDPLIAKRKGKQHG
jgi:hypothetical protein